MSMKLNLKLLATRFSQAKEEPLVASDGINRYLIDNVLTPAMGGKTLYVRDIDFSAFGQDDIEALVEYHYRLNQEMQKLGQFAGPVSQALPTPRRTRTFC